ncbi:autoinducer binding domain-containing protein [Mesorhizobium sp. M1169]|uniref:hypothetical protein n=1 Tax=Mesorhizobium sp. M1169 TaxID=2957066 RepID=UPI00333859A3
MSDQFSLVPSMHFQKAAKETFAVEFGRFLDQTDGAAQSEQMFDLLSAFALHFDCPWIAYGSLAPGQNFLNPVRGDPGVRLNYPDQWQERCL